MGSYPKELCDYYQSYHRIIEDKYLQGYAICSMHIYLQGFADPITESFEEQDHDGLVEI